MNCFEGAPMRILEDLTNEHNFIIRYLDLIEKYNTFHGNGRDLLFHIGIDLITFIKKFAHDFHHKKEEKLLFPQLENSQILTQCNPIPVMQKEHTLGVNFVDDMKYALELRDVNSFSVHIRDYAMLLRTHIQKEETILYPMIRESLSKSVKDSIDVEYETFLSNYNEAIMWKTFESDYQAIIGYLDSNFVEHIPQS